MVNHTADVSSASGPRLGFEAGGSSLAACRRYQLGVLSSG